jgi:hypothetical protein
VTKRFQQILLTILLLGSLGGIAIAQAPGKVTAAPEKPPAEKLVNPIVIKMVTDFDSRKLVSDVEEREPVTETQFGQNGSHELTLGEKCTLWVRNAHLDRKFFFERYYQGKYVGRSSQLEIEAAQLGPGEHTLEPGGHKFTLSPDNKLASSDPDIKIDGNTLLLRLHKVTVQGVDAAKTGPPEFRLVPADIGLLALDAKHTLDPAKLPNASQTFDPQKPPEANQPISPLMNVLSNQAQFYPLSIWLPSNQVGQGYVLYPSWQAFHLTPEGQVDVESPHVPKVPGIEIKSANIVIPYRLFSGMVNSRTKLTAGVGNVKLDKKMSFGATIAPTRFVASHEQPPEDFFLANARASNAQESTGDDELQPLQSIQPSLARVAANRRSLVDE